MTNRQTLYQLAYFPIGLPRPCGSTGSSTGKSSDEFYKKADQQINSIPNDTGCV